MGGEKGHAYKKRQFGGGSPPRGRGKVPSPLHTLHPKRITPAWAGKSTIPCVSRFLLQDHPRVGGEKLAPAPTWFKSHGSPPRGRGKGLSSRLSGLSERITPAWAGKSNGPPRRGLALQDHPRVGGEKFVERTAAHLPPGSPPRGRGKGLGFSALSDLLGITPAWAGKRLKRSHRSGIFISGPIPFHSVLHRPAGSGGSRAGRDGSPAGQPQNAGPA